MEKPYEEDKIDVRNRKRTSEEIAEYLRNLPCAMCGSIPACDCKRPKPRPESYRSRWKRENPGKEMPW